MKNILIQFRIQDILYYTNLETCLKLRSYETIRYFCKPTDTQKIYQIINKPDNSKINNNISCTIF